MKTLPVFCGKDCGGNACPLLAAVEKDRVIKVTNNPAAGKFIIGCRRGYSLPQEAYAPSRILTPLLRTGSKGSRDFREASWEEALRFTASKLRKLQEKYGFNSVLNLASAGSTGALHNTDYLLSRFLNLSGGATAQTSNYSSGASSFILPYLFGKEWNISGFEAASLRDSKLIILWGANPLEARLGTDVDLNLLAAKKRGAEIVVIDPRRSATARTLSAWWLPCRPGTDAALMLSVMYQLFKENLADRAAIGKYSAGFDDLENYILGRMDGIEKSPSWASGICGISAEEIVRFTRLYGTAKPALLFPGYSIQRVYAGEEPFRLTVALQITTGNFGLRGGSTGSMNNRLKPPRTGVIPVPRIPDQPLIPVVRWPDAVIEGRKGGYPSDLRAVYTAGGNFLNQGSDIKKNIEAFNKLDFAVCHEQFLTPTARYCDVILPAAHTLEREDIGIPWSRNFLAYKAEAHPPRGKSRTDYDIFCDLADRMGFGADFSENRSAADWIRLFLDQSEIEDQEKFRREGVYLPANRGSSGLSRFFADPLGFPLSTPSGKVEISSGRYNLETAFSPFPVWQEPPAEQLYPLLLITPKASNRTHSQGFGNPAIQEIGSHFLEIHKNDARQRGLKTGSRAGVFNRQGKTIVTVKVSEEIAQGTVSLPEGAWVELTQEGFDTAGSANMLTSTEGTLPGFAVIMHGVPVQVEKAG